MVLMNKADIARINMREGDRVVLSTAAADGVRRELGDLGDVVRDPGEMHPRLLPGMQRAHPALALRQGKQGASCEVGAGPNRAAARCAIKGRRRVKPTVGMPMAAPLFALISHTSSASSVPFTRCYGAPCGLWPRYGRHCFWTGYSGPRLMSVDLSSFLDSTLQNQIARLRMAHEIFKPPCPAR